MSPSGAAGGWRRQDRDRRTRAWSFWEFLPLPGDSELTSGFMHHPHCCVSKKKRFFWWGFADWHQPDLGLGAARRTRALVLVTSWGQSKTLGYSRRSNGLCLPRETLGSPPWRASACNSWHCGWIRYLPSVPLAASSARAHHHDNELKLISNTTTTALWGCSAKDPLHQVIGNHLEFVRGSSDLLVGGHEQGWRFGEPGSHPQLAPRVPASTVLP